MYVTIDDSQFNDFWGSSNRKINLNQIEKCFKKIIQLGGTFMGGLSLPAFVLAYHSFFHNYLCGCVLAQRNVLFCLASRPCLVSPNESTT